MSFQPLLELTRGGLIETRHSGAIAVADSHGRLIAHYGDPNIVVFLRSSAKPLQALPLVESGAARAFGLTLREIALACASHAGLEMHVETARAMQAKIGLSEAALECGTHPVENPETAAQMALAGVAPSPIYNNCSGKHTGMLAVAKHLGLPLSGYTEPQHPLQQRIVRTMAEMFGLPPQSIGLGIDGCSAPNFAVPLVNAAAGFARLVEANGSSPARGEAARVICAAMSAHPEMVQGPGGSDTELMRVRPGLIIAKRGAEGYQAIGLAPGALGPGSPALGVALKVADGTPRAVPFVAMEVLRQLGALREPELAQLAGHGFVPPQVLKNWRGLTVGEARACFRLEFA